MNKQLFKILHFYLKKTGISHNKSRLKQLLYSHPEHNSLYAMVDVLDELNIENIALRTDVTGLQANGFPVIVHTKEDEGTFLVVDNIIGEAVHYYKAGSGRGAETLDSFSAKWEGVALYVATDELPAATIHEKISLNERLLLWRVPLAVLAGLACVAVWSISVDWSATLTWLLSLSVLGLAVSILLTMHEFGESNQLLHKVCHLNRLTNCNAVLRSPAAKLFGWLSMSDIGLCYFAGGILSLMLAGITQHIGTAISWLLALALCTFPYTVFSLWYQAFTVKKWCPLCLAVIGALWAEIALAVASWSDLIFIPVPSVAVFSLLFGLSLSVLAWAYVKPLWKEYIRIREFEYLYLRLKNSPMVVRALLAKEPVRNMEFTEDEIQLGTINAPVHITAVMSLYCRPCAREWETLNQWLTTYPGSLWLTVRFTGYHPQNGDLQELIDRLTGIFVDQGQESFREALTDWFEIREPQKWKAKYFALQTVQQPVSSKNAQWEQSLPITYTPTVFVDDRVLPSMYRVKDLEYLLKEL